MKEIKNCLPNYGDAPMSEELIQGIFADENLLKKLRSIGLSNEQIRENCIVITDYQRDLAVCQKCPGAKLCPKDYPMAVQDLSLENGVLGRTFIPCEKNDVMLDPKYNFVFRDFPVDWFDETLYPLSLRPKRSFDVFKTLSKAMSNPAHPWAYLLGKPGVGKSFLAARFAIAYAKQGHRIAFINTKVRFDQLKEISYKEPATFDSLMVRIVTSDLVIFDDFGSEYHSDYVRDRLLMPILTLRAKNHQHTFFTSRSGIDQIVDFYSYNRTAREFALKIGELLAEQIGPFGTIEVPLSPETLLSK